MKNFNKNLFIYGLIPVFTKASGFILLPFYINFLDSRDFGYLELFLTLFSFATLLINAEIYTAIGRYYYECNELKEKRKLISSGLVITLFLAFLVTTLMYFFSDFILMKYVQNYSQFNFYILGISYVLFNAISTYLSVIPRYDNKAKLFTIINGLGVAVKLGAILFFLIYLNHGLLSVIEGHLCHAIFLTICYVFINKVYLKFTVDFNSIKKILRYSGRLVPYIFLIGFWEPFSRYLLVDIFSTSEIGLLNFTIRLASLLELINAAIHMTWMPLLFENHNNESFKSDANNISNNVSVVLLSFVIIFSLTSPEIVSLLNANKFRDSILILNVLLILNYFKIMVRLRGYLPYTNNKVYVLSISQLIGYLVSILFFLLVKNKLGILGMAFFVTLPFAINYICLASYTNVKSQITFSSIKENTLLFLCFALTSVHYYLENILFRYFLVGIVIFFLIYNFKLYDLAFNMKRGNVKNN
ncbi:lipopolysaccharide biosynthesis protein [Aquiflexum sp.]|uniref:lipopolysaccharide biosynthesis protein n=1 Tax=Aquiflexum sp. TaxID=1872584 RepID=UPI00359448F3